MNSKLWQKIATDFAKDRQALVGETGKKVLVYYDNVPSHYLTKLMEQNKMQDKWNKGILANGYLLANGTHFQQPVELSVIVRYKLFQ